MVLTRAGCSGGRGNADEPVSDRRGAGYGSC